MRVNKVTLNYCLARRQQEMVTRRRRNQAPLLPVQDPRCCRDSITVPFWPGVLWSPPHHQSAVCFLSLHPRPPLSCTLTFFLPFLLAVVCSYLATLSCKPHPVCTAAGQTLSLRDAKDISQAITFSAWVRYRYNWFLPAGEVLGRHNEGEKKKTSEQWGGGQARFRLHFHQEPIKISMGSPHINVFCHIPEHKDQHTDKTKIGWKPHSSWAKAKRGQKSS